jgi:glutathione S-transferase
MQILYHYPLCPLSRQARILLKEFNIVFSLLKEDYWLRSEQLLKFNPAAELPIFVEPFNIVIAGIYPLIEYINDKHPQNNLIDNEPEKAAEVRRLLNWFNTKFYLEVSKIFLDEKLVRLLKNLGSPRMDFLRVAKSNLQHHMAYMSSLLHERTWLAYDKMSFVDFAACSHLSVLDYFGEIIWEQYPNVKEWYALMKSRPSFRPFLQDQVAGFSPPKYYSDLDF